MKYALVLMGLLATSVQASDFSGSVGITSNYMSRGTEQNVYHDPAVMLFAQYTKAGFYVSTFAANMNYGEGTKNELDFFGGYRKTANAWTFDVGFASINYPGSPNNWQFVEYDFKADRTVGKGSVGIWIGWTDSYFYSYGKGLWTELHGSYPITSTVSVSGGIANQDLENGFAYSTYNVGVTWSAQPTLLVDVRFSDTNKHELDPWFHTYDDRVSVTLTKLF